jgi:hypothetical protein
MEKWTNRSKKWKLLASLVILGTLSGCSATTLRCGVSGGDSYVELINLPQDITGQSRNFQELCGFAYEGETKISQQGDVR